MAKPVITIPLGMTFKNWINAVAIDVGHVNLPVKFDESQWRKYAAALLLNKNFSGAPLPSATVYPKKEDWRKWAMDFIATF